MRFKLISIAVIAGIFATTLWAGEERQRVLDRVSGWQRAVVNVAVPLATLVDGNRRHSVEHCSGTLIRSRGRLLVVSAWHCFDGIRDLTQPAIITIGNWPAREARLIKSGSSMAADWALLEFITPAKADDKIFSLPLDPGPPPDIGQSVIMAGFSGDAFGDFGATLTFDPGCHVQHQAGSRITTNCKAFRGASGGPVLIRADNGEHFLSGVVSQGDSEGLSIFVHASSFRRQLPGLN